jgi:glutamate synthase (NADPH/NADH) large chain
MAFLYDAEGSFEQRVNPESLRWCRAGASAHWVAALREHVERHVEETGSPFASRLLNDWGTEAGKFWHVVPKDFARYLPQPMEDALAVAAE